MVAANKINEVIEVSSQDPIQDLDHESEIIKEYNKLNEKLSSTLNKIKKRKSLGKKTTLK